MTAVTGDRNSFRRFSVPDLAEFRGHPPACATVFFESFTSSPVFSAPVYASCGREPTISDCRSVPAMNEDTCQLLDEMSAAHRRYRFLVDFKWIVVTALLPLSWYSVLIVDRSW